MQELSVFQVKKEDVIFDICYEGFKGTAIFA